MAEFVTIDPEFKTLLAPLTDEEYALLEQSIIAEGCRDPITIWGDKQTILDGHNRYAICKKHNIEYYLNFADDSIQTREDAINWIINNQLGRRNLTPEQASYLRGKRYQREKKQGERTDLTSYQNDTKSQTAKRLADEYKVGEATIKRDAAYASAVDRLASAGGEDVRAAILKRDAPVTKRDVMEVAGALDTEPERAMESINRIKAGEYDSRRETREQPSNLDRLKDLWARCNDEERLAFLLHIGVTR